MSDILLVPLAMLIVLVAIHAYFGLGVLQRKIIFADLAIAQFAALGSAISYALFHGAYLFATTLTAALSASMLIAIGTHRKIPLEPYIGMLYVFGASASMLVLANSAEGVEHFKALLASDILFVLPQQALQSSLLYAAIALVMVLVYPRLQGFAKELLFLSLLALTVTSSIQLVGVFVVFVLLVGPALLATMQAQYHPVVFATLYGWMAGDVAIVMAYYFDLPTGYTIVFVLSLLTLVLALWQRQRKG
jgi:zinc/manganese transport system permease protein